MGQVSNSKNELFLLSKHTTNTSLSVPEIAFGSPARTTVSYTQNDSSFSQQRSHENSEKRITEGGDALSRQNTIDTNQKSSVSDHVIVCGEPLPSLENVLMNKSGSPLSQYNFYSYLRQDWQGEENLNFWLDVVAHENLFESWREYQNHIRKARERRSYEEKGNIIYEEEDESEEQEVVEEWEPDHNHNNSTSSAGGGVTASIDSKNPVIKSFSHEITILDKDPSENYGKPEIIKRISEDDLVKSAQNIYQKYGHMDILPEENRNTMSDLIERQGRYNPVVFSSSKSYVYHIMNVIYFPKFVQSAIDMNLTHIHAVIALPLGVVALAFGFSLELYDIFMGWENRLLRLYWLPVVWLGWILLQTAATRFLPILSIFGVSETKLFRFHRIRERAILQAHRKRALVFIMWDTIVSVITLGILFAIPPITLYNK